jgi:Protein of unknown function (DUF2480)
MSEEITNKVAQSSLHTLDLEQFYPAEVIRIFDLKDYLFMEQILKEKDFRAALQAADFSSFQGCIAGIHCSADAIIPVWAYMLVTTYLQPIAKEVVMGDEEAVLRQLITNRIQAVNPEIYIDQRIVIKGCGEKKIGEYAFLEITKKLRPVAKSIMYGEPCSTVPVFKATKTGI